MKFFETSKYHFFKKSTYISLRWIGIIGQLISVNFVYFFLNFNFDFIISNLVIFFGILSNLFLIYIYKKTQLSDRSAFIFLVIDILQLGALTLSNRRYYQSICNFFINSKYLFFFKFKFKNKYFISTLNSNYDSFFDFLFITIYQCLLKVIFIIIIIITILFQLH